MKKGKYKYIFIMIEERNGEQEYTFRIVREIPESSDMQQVAEDEAREWYGEDEGEEYDGHYEFFGGAIQTKVESVREIPKADYDVLTKYI